MASKRLKFFVLLVLLGAVGIGQAQGLDLEDLAWNAGAITIDIGESYGQGYLAFDPNSPTGLSIFTIEHVLDGARTSWVSVPGFTSSEVPIDRYFCNRRFGDEDNSCGFEISAAAAELILSFEANLVPYVRDSAPPELQVCSLVGTPRPDTGLWTVYVVTAILQEELMLRAYGLPEVSNLCGYPTQQTVGNFCHGRSGGPVVLVNFDQGVITPVTNDGGLPLVVAELQEGLGEGIPDYLDPTNHCYLYIVANRVS